MALGSDRHGNDAKLVATIPSRFEGVRRLGRGAEGGAFEGYDRVAAVRVVLKSVSGSRWPVVAHAFNTLRKIGSPHLPAPRELLTTATGAHWIVSQWVDGRPLPPGPVPIATAVVEARGVAHALGAIHRAGTHHGDLSADNVLLTPARGSVVIDLSQLGRFGSGTPGFLAPEVLAGGGGPSADRFALGCLLCWRLYGEVPWQRPERLMAVRTRGDVAARILELGAQSQPLPRRLRHLLVSLLLPDPADRVASTEAVIDRLAQLEAADVRRHSVGGSSWWVPDRLPYRGADLSSTVSALKRPDRPRLVAVCGPAGAGRGRVVEELIQSIQAAGRTTGWIDVRPAGGPDDSGNATWIEDWTAADPERTAILGVRRDVVWPAGLLEGQSDAAVVGIQSALLRASASIARSTLIIPIGGELGLKLRQAGGDELVVLELRPASLEQVGAMVRDTTDEPEDGPEAWAKALVEATGGWPGATVRALRACAAADVRRASVGNIERALLESSQARGDLDEGVARSVLLLHWAPSEDRARAVPSSLRRGGVPHPSAVVQARQRLGAQVRELAQQLTSAVQSVSLGLAIDAELVPVVDELTASLDTLVGHRDADALVSWLERRDPSASSPKSARLAISYLLAQGQPARALTLARRSQPSPRIQIEVARALQMLGRVDEALQVLDRIRDTLGDGDSPLRWRALGLRLRLLVDRGCPREAVELAGDQLAVAPKGAAGGLALLWAGFAAVAAGDVDQAERWLGLAQAATRDVSGPEAAGVSARVSQVLGTLAYQRGALQTAMAEFERANAQFDRAGEAMGSILVRGSVAALAIATADIEVGLSCGRAVLRSLLARGQLAALPEAIVNLVQLLRWIGAVEEIASLTELLASCVGGPRGTAVAKARVERVRADLAATRVITESGGLDPLEVEARYARSAEGLEAAQLERESLDAWLRAAAWARTHRRWEPAQAHLSRAEAIAKRCTDPTATVELAVEVVAVWAAVGRPSELEAALARLQGLVPYATVREQGRLELCWTYDRAIWAAFDVLGVERGAMSTVRRRAVRTLETIMTKTSPIDRSAVVASLVGDAAQASGLREILHELEGGSSSVTPSAATVTPGVDDAAHANRLEQLIRIYRRFAREDRLGPLLEQVVDAVMELTDAERGAVVVRHKSGRRFEVTRELAAQGQGIKFSRSVIERVLETDEPVLSVDAAQDDRFDQSRSIGHLNLRSVLAVPLRFRGDVLGAVYVDHRLRRGNFDESDLRHVEAFAELAALAVAHTEALEEVRSQAEELKEQGRKLQSLLDAREAEVAGLRERVRHSEDRRGGYRGLVGATAAMQTVYRLIDRLADSDVPVVIYGQSGTGKELVARAIHEAGRRSQHPFVAENCGAIPETLLESVLFGHAKGAFTGASAAKTGLFEAADGGTVFLDEVGEMSAAMQTKLLRVLQESEVRRVGENRPRPINVRVIAASNRDLDAMAEQGSFRRDLYYRINVVRVDLPPLSERTDDIVALVEHFWTRYADGRELRLQPAVVRALCSHSWPGNVRELENEVRRWLALSEGAVELSDLSPSLARTPDRSSADPDDLRIRPAVEQLERGLIARALERTGGNQTKAAEILGLSRYGLQKKMRRMEL